MKQRVPRRVVAADASFIPAGGHRQAGPRIGPSPGSGMVNTHGPDAEPMVGEGIEELLDPEVETPRRRRGGGGEQVDTSFDLDAIAILP